MHSGHNVSFVVVVFCLFVFKLGSSPSQRPTVEKQIGKIYNGGYLSDSQHLWEKVCSLGYFSHLPLF